MGFLADHGASIQKDWLRTNNDPALVKSYGEWIEECSTTLNNLSDAAYVIQFKNAHGSALMGCPTNHSVNGCGYWQEIQGKNQMLMNVIADLQRH